MKTMRYLFYMLLLLSNIEVLRGDYSIDTLLNYLQEKGYYDIIQAVKIYFGNDVAIDVCKELVKSNQCDIVVRIYMTTETTTPDIDGSGPQHAPAHINPEAYEKIFNAIKKKYENIFEGLENLILLILSYYSILIEGMSDREIYDFIVAIIDNKGIIKRLLFSEKTTGKIIPIV